MWQFCALSAPMTFAKALSLDLGRLQRSAFQLKIQFPRIFSIATEFKQLKPLKVYKETARHLAKAGKTEAITNLVILIKSAVKDQRVDDICDEVLILAITILSKTDAIEAEVEELIKLICDKSAMVSLAVDFNGNKELCNVLDCRFALMLRPNS